LTAPEGIIVKGERLLVLLEGSLNGTTSSIGPCSAPKDNDSLGDGVTLLLLMMLLRRRRIGILIRKAILLQLIQPIIIVGIRCLLTETNLIRP
jgi:hypothetical protein